ncbi:hypothetical protein QOZ80_6AG0529290 [Eleusine coracana subsp. coracana]|nr:hypothetical protein QOZ80_6AG0529290 [Eleusine coracana subsp. coracana]
MEAEPKDVAPEKVVVIARSLSPPRRASSPLPPRRSPSPSLRTPPPVMEVEPKDSALDKAVVNLLVGSSSLVANAFSLSPPCRSPSPSLCASSPLMEAEPEIVDVQDVVIVPDSEEQDKDYRFCGDRHGRDAFEECLRIRREKSRCSRCGLVHSDYDVTARLLDGFEYFDCEIYIPNMEEHKMHGDIIILPEHVEQRLNEISPLRKKLKLEEEASKTNA